MSIKDRMKAYDTEDRVTCGYQKILSKLNAEDTKDLQYLIDKKFPLATIARILTAEGHPVSKDTIRIHLIGMCRCPGEAK
jgi:hypothetical protein